MNCKYCDETHGLWKTKLLETPHWMVFLDQHQDYLGRCVIALKRHAPSLSSLSEEEITDFLEVSRKIESAVKTAFKCEMFNWTLLMNNSFKKEPFDPHVHWHVRPRYKESVEFNGKEFTDPDFGKHYDRTRKSDFSEDLLKAIIEKIQENVRQ